MTLTFADTLTALHYFRYASCSFKRATSLFVPPRNMFACFSRLWRTSQCEHLQCYPDKNWCKAKQTSFPCTSCLIWRPIIHNLWCDYVFTHTRIHLLQNYAIRDTCTFSQTLMLDHKGQIKKKSYTVALTWQQRAITLHNFRASFSNLQCLLVHIKDTSLLFFSLGTTDLHTQRNLRARIMIV